MQETAKKVQDTMVFDCLDTLQGYAGAPPGASKQFYQAHLAQVEGMSVEALLEQIPYEEQCRMTGEEIRKGNLKPVALDGAEGIVACVRSFGIRPVIVTADFPETAALAAKPLVDAGLIGPEDVYAIAALGSKKAPETWKNARECYFPGGEIMGVFEDTKANLTAAVEAYATDGYWVQAGGESSPAQAKQTDREITIESAEGLYSFLPARDMRGTLRSLRGPLEERLTELQRMRKLTTTSSELPPALWFT